RAAADVERRENPDLRRPRSCPPSSSARTLPGHRASTLRHRMNLEPPQSEAQLRAQVRAWLRDHPPWGDGKGLPPRFEDLADEVAFGREWQAKLAEGRWVGVAWPEEYGGRGAGAVEHFIVTEELARARAPELVGRIGVNLVGPTLLAHGTPAPQGRWPPDILSAPEPLCP